MTRAVAKFRAVCGLALVLAVSLAARGDEPGGVPITEGRAMVLWYRSPAKGWNEALPIGNGRLGAMVFGRTGSERIQLNEDTIWAGERRDRGNPAAFENLAEVRRLLFAGKPAEAEDLAERTMIAIPKRLPPYQPLGDLLLRFPGHEEIEATPGRDGCSSQTDRVQDRLSASRIHERRVQGENRPDTRPVSPVFATDHLMDPTVRPMD
jgi:hypothetical protein